jgi:hypothetical protein
MNKLNKILLVAVIVLLLAFGVVLYWQRGGFETKYSAVYFSTGDLYFGKLSHFPKLKLSNVWLLQRNSNDAQNPFGISQFNKAFWGPEDELYLDSKNIIWTTELRNDSQLTQFLKNPEAAKYQVQQPAEYPTSTNK